MVGKADNPILDQQQALDNFFESLMRDVDAYADRETAGCSDPQVRSERDNLATTVIAPHPTLVSPSIPVMVESPAALFETLPPPVSPTVEVIESEIEKPILKSEPVTLVADESPTATESAIAEPEHGDPAWLGQELQAMLFKVAGLTLAVPLVDLNGVVEWDEEAITTMPGHADFYLGLMTHLNRKIPVVDTARLVLPENKRVALAGEDPRQRVTRVVLINDSQYGLACDEVNEVITLKADAVRWRSQRTQRRWLAGTVIEHMCALVDATAFADLLANRAPVDAFRD